jgi:hypothetical protein
MFSHSRARAALQARIGITRKNPPHPAGAPPKQRLETDHSLFPVQSRLNINSRRLHPDG